MARHSHGSGTRLAVVLFIVVAGAALLTMLAVAGAAFYWLLAVDAPQQVHVTWDSGPDVDTLIDETSITEERNHTFPLRVERAARQADGGWKIFVAGARSRGGRIEGIRFTDVRVADLAVGECQVTLPAAPFPKTIDFVIHTPPIPADRQKVRIDYVLHANGSDDSGGGFSESLDGSLTVDLKNRAAPVKAEALPE